MRKILLSYGLFLVSVLAFSQAKDNCSFELTGDILNADTKEPLPYVQVRIKDTQKTATTDANGEFSFTGLCSEANTLIISCFGYCDTVCEQHHQHGKTPHIFLKEKVNVLDHVTIKIPQHGDEGTETIAQATIEKEELAQDPNQSLGTVLSNIDGVTFTSTGNNIQLPVIHGLYGNRILVLNNGIMQGFQNWSTDHAPEIDVSLANSVTVVKGAAGVRYGPEAIGGAIVVDHAPLYLKEPLKANIGSGFQSNGRGYFVNSEVSKGTEKWSYHLGTHYTRVGDKHTPDTSLTNSGKEETSVNAGLRYHLKNWDVKVHYSYIDQTLALLRSSVAHSGNSLSKAINSDQPVIANPFSYSIGEPRQEAQHHLGKAKITWYYSDEGKLTLTYGHQFNQRKEYDVRRNADKPIIDLDLLTTDLQLEWKHPDWWKLDGLIGIQLLTQNNDNNPGTGTTAFIPNYNRIRNSGYILETLKRNKNTYEFGLRFDNEYNNVRGRETSQEVFRDDYIYTNLTSSLGLVHEVSDDFTLRTNLGSAWRTPNVAELYRFGQSGFKNCYGLLRYYTDADNNVKTDRVLTMEEANIEAEKGFKWINEIQLQKETHTTTITAYAHLIDNFIFTRPMGIIGTIRGPMPIFIVDQADAAFVGTDITWQKKLSKTISGTFGASYLWSKNIKKNEALINQPPLNTNAKLVWKKKGLWKFDLSQLSVMPSYTFKQFQAPQTISPERLVDGSASVNADSEIFDFKDAPNGYFLLDLAWQIEKNQWTARFAVNNLLNTRYRNYLNQMRYFADEPGINFLLSINYVFNSKSYQK